MPSVQCWQVDAFTGQPFAGNPAAVCWLDQDVPEAWMQAVAAEMNMAETAFVTRREDGYGLRWFTPTIEVDLCGHATLASAHVLVAEGLHPAGQPIQFHTRSGLLTCNRQDGAIQMDFPATPVRAADPPDGLLEALDASPTFVGRSQFDYLVVVEDAETLRSLAPDFRKLADVPTRGVIVTCRSGDERCDFLSRFFAPAVGVDEDPVTGSAHCCLGPYWADVLGKSGLTGFQASPRGGVVQVQVAPERVRLGGRAVTVWKGELTAPWSRSRQRDEPPADLSYRTATAEDVPLLASMNKQLIEDEASRNPMSGAEIERRMDDWLRGEWQAVVIEQNGEPVGYALYQRRSDEYAPCEVALYLRQFFISREHRGCGIGQQAFEELTKTHFADTSSIVLNVLEANVPARRFWEMLGFRPYSTMMVLKQ